MEPKIPKGYKGTFMQSSDGKPVLVMVSRTEDLPTNNKRSETMANNKNDKNFKPTFVKYSTMNEREKSIFKQGATTANNNIKEKLGLKKPRS